MIQLNKIIEKRKGRIIMKMKKETLKSQVPEILEKPNPD